MLMKKKLAKAAIAAVAGLFYALYKGNCGLTSRGTGHPVGQFLLWIVSTATIWKTLDILEDVLTPLIRNAGRMIEVTGPAISTVAALGSAMDIVRRPRRILY